MPCREAHVRGSPRWQCALIGAVFTPQRLTQRVLMDELPRWVAASCELGFDLLDIMAHQTRLELIGYQELLLEIASTRI
jgi:hypothetical protein